MTHARPTLPTLPATPAPRPRAALLVAAAAVAGAGCAYDPPKAGRHSGPGEPRAEVQCSYETQAASRFISLRCLRAEDKESEGDAARRTADSIRTPVPDIR